MCVCTERGESERTASLTLTVLLIAKRATLLILRIGMLDIHPPMYELPRQKTFENVQYSHSTAGGQRSVAERLPASGI